MSTAATAPIFGRAWVFGDRIDTDLLAPGHAMRKPLEELSKHCLEAVRPEFAREVARGDLLVAGEGFGIGSSREQAAQALRFLGVSPASSTAMLSTLACRSWSYPTPGRSLTARGSK